MLEEVISRLYVGGDKDFERVRNNSGWAFLRCCKNGPGSHRDLVGYSTMAAPKGKNYLAAQRGNVMALNMVDVDDPAYFADEMIQAGLKFINQHYKAGDKVLVACNAGHSRGPTTMLMYLRTIGEMSNGFIQSEKKYRTLCPDYDPNQGIRQYARDHWGSLENLNASISE